MMLFLLIQLSHWSPSIQGSNLSKTVYRVFSEDPKNIRSNLSHCLFFDP